MSANLDRMIDEILACPGCEALTVERDELAGLLAKNADLMGATYEKALEAMRIRAEAAEARVAGLEASIRRLDTEIRAVHGTDLDIGEFPSLWNAVVLARRTLSGPAAGDRP